MKSDYSFFNWIDNHYFYNDRLGQAFGLEKVYVQNELRSINNAENKKLLSESLNQMAAYAGRHEKEADWAVVGGLAQGIGGVGAGIAGAINTQIQNAEIRARNIQRDLNAKAIREASGAIVSSIDIPAEAQLTAEEIKGLRVKLDEDTANLFQKLKITAKFKDIPTGGERDTTFFNWVTDQNYKYLRFVKISFETSSAERIDGYVQMNMFTNNGKLLYKRSIPLPLLGVGTLSSTLSVYLPNDVASVTFEPIVLWKLVDQEAADCSEAYCIADIPSAKLRYTFEEYWKEAWKRYTEEADESTTGANRRKWKLIWILLGSVIVMSIILRLYYM